MYRCMTFSKKLVIVESPAKCKKIESYLGTGYKVIACYGHLRDIHSLANIDIENGYKPTYTILDNKKLIIEKIRKEIRSCYEVILATDDDREGEAIAWHICDMFELSVVDTKRILFHEITEEAIHRAIENPTRIDMNRVYSQQARQVIDLMVGYMISPILWKSIINTAIISAGRCQTPTLRLIYENHLNKTNTMHYSISGYFTSKNILFELNHQYKTELEVITFLEHSCLFQHKISSYIEKKTAVPPQPFTTFRLLRASPYSASETMKICQLLYEDGLITYMRTDSTNYSQEFISSVHSFIQKEYHNEKYIGDFIEKGDMTAHEAIRPTNIHMKQLCNESYNQKEVKLYRLIWENSLESLMSDIEYNENTIIVDAPFDLKYTRKVIQVLFQGWSIVKNMNMKKNESNEYNYFLHFKMDQPISYNHISCKPLYHTTPFLSEIDLLRSLERVGIGRPSTYASLVQKIQDRKYVTKQTITHKIEEDEYDFIYGLTNNHIDKKRVTRVRNKEHNKLVIQPLGIQVMECLMKYSSIFDYDFTKKMEEELDEILYEKKSYYDVCHIMYTQLKQIIGEHFTGKLPSTILRVLNDNTSIRTNRKGEPYIYYKTSRMKRPKFYSLNALKEDYMTCNINDILLLMKT